MGASLTASGGHVSKPLLLCWEVRFMHVTSSEDFGRDMQEVIQPCFHALSLCCEVRLVKASVGTRRSGCA